MTSTTPGVAQRGEFDLAGRRALVTGASRGIGRALVLGLAAHGASVLGVARSADGLADTVELAKGTRGSVQGHTADLRNAESVEQAVDAAAETLGGLDIVVNNAAEDHHGRIEDTDLATWQRIIELDLQSYWLLAKAASPRFEDDGGKVINISSICGVVGLPDNSVYIAAKHGVVGITRALAIEWARRNIQVNAIAPGSVETEMMREMLANEANARYIKRHTPMGRWAQPAEMVGPAVFLASRASDFMTGQVLVVDGGWTAQ
jgi:NAD(P)-dependent dehydrogenase (short-subunit alcohol dehydrogenase family)